MNQRKVTDIELGDIGHLQNHVIAFREAQRTKPVGGRMDFSLKLSVCDALLAAYNGNIGRVANNGLLEILIERFILP